MFIGNDIVIESRKIIAILDIELVNQSRRLQSVVKQKTADNMTQGNKDEAKSMIITDDEMYFSPLSTLTLKNRDELYQTIS